MKTEVLEDIDEEVLTNFQITEYKGKAGYWVRIHHFLLLSNYKKHHLTDMMRDRLYIPKTYYIKSSNKVLYFFVITETPLFTPLDAKIFKLQKEADGFLLPIVKENNRSGYYLSTGDFAELIGSCKSYVTTLYQSDDPQEHPESAALNKKSPKKWQFFIPIDPEPYTKEEALAYRNTQLINRLESTKVAKDDILEFKEIRVLTSILRNNPGIIEKIEKISDISPEELDVLLNLGTKMKNLFD